MGRTASSDRSSHLRSSGLSEAVRGSDHWRELPASVRLPLPPAVQPLRRADRRLRRGLLGAHAGRRVLPPREDLPAHDTGRLRRASGALRGRRSLLLSHALHAHPGQDHDLGPDQIDVQRQSVEGNVPRQRSVGAATETTRIASSGRVVASTADVACPNTRRL